MIARILKIAGLSTAFILIAGASAYFTLTLIIKSEEAVIVPELVGKEVVYALETLTDLELNTKVKGSEYSVDIPKHHVIFQDPGPGMEIKKGRDVRIIISKGPKNILMPNLIALSARQARIILDENGMCRGITSFTDSDTIAKEDIIAQVPDSGKIITRGMCVDLLISMGMRPRAYEMPDLSGLPLDRALLFIEKSELNVAEINSDFFYNKPLNVIVKQDPPFGHRVLAGHPVNLMVNRRSAWKEKLHGISPVSGTLFQYQATAGFLKKHIWVELTNNEGRSIIFDEYIKPNDEIWLFIPRDEDTTLFLYENDIIVETKIYAAW
jgi:serine/threonine-protein kinase